MSLNAKFMSALFLVLGFWSVQAAANTYCHPVYHGLSSHIECVSNGCDGNCSRLSSGGGGGGDSSTGHTVGANIWNRTSYHAYYSIRCNNAGDWMNSTLDPNMGAQITCRNSDSIVIRFQKSWLNGCGYQTQEYSMSLGDNKFVSTYCGMDLYQGS